MSPPDHKTKIVATIGPGSESPEMLERLIHAGLNVALSRDTAVRQGLAFSYGVHPVQLAKELENWREFARTWLREHQLLGAVAMLVAGPSTRHPDANHRIEFLRVDKR